MSIRVAIIEDETMVADMLKAWFRRRPQMEVVGCAADGTSALALCRKLKPDVVTLDIQLPGMNGLDLADKFRHELPDMKIIIVTCRNNPYCLLRAEELGVHGFVDKMSPLPVLEKAVRTVMAGERFFSESMSAELQQEQRKSDSFSKILTEREREILGLISLGLSDAEVGAQLDISPGTVGLHRRTASRKLDIFNDRKLMRIGRELGLDFNANHQSKAATKHRQHRQETV